MTRRQILVFTLAAPGVLVWRRLAQAQGLEKFTMPTVACKDDKPTPGVADDKTFRAGAPARTSLADASTPGRKLVLSGTVKGVVCGPIKGARVDFWQPDAGGVYDASGFRLRGHQLTDANGRYRLETIVPASTSGRARHLSAKVAAAGKPGVTTALYFPDDPANAHDPAFRPELLMKVTSGADVLTATFDFVLDA
jgi:protocatechuate 3,4-dioxygenase beta subunit